MTGSYDRQREYDGPINSGYLPPHGHEACREHNDQANRKEAEEEGEPETSNDPRDFDEEVGLLDLLLGRGPRHVD